MVGHQLIAHGHRGLCGASLVEAGAAELAKLTTQHRVEDVDEGVALRECCAAQLGLAHAVSYRTLCLMEVAGREGEGEAAEQALNRRDGLGPFEPAGRTD